jgi:branched-chain amino acid transport system substrate-binding protein
MQSSRYLRTLARASVGGCFALMLTLSACGSGGSTSVNKALILATDFPVSGGDATATLPAEYAVNLAVSQANLGGGYTLTVKNMDDEGQSGADPTKGQNNIQQLADNKQVMAIVGPFNSGVAKAEIPVVNAAGGPVLISPTNTNPGLTLSQYATANGIDFTKLHPTGKPNYYFRIPGNDVAQGKADAEVALSPTLPGGACTKAFVVDDNTTYGKGLGDFFTAAFTAGGGTTVGTRSSITADQIATLPQLATAIKASGATCTFYGGVTSQGGPVLKKDLAAIGGPAIMIGGDGIAADPGFITTAGAAAAAGTVGTVAAPDTSTLTSGAATTFKSAYTTFTASLPNNALLPYSAQAYDAAQIEITAIKNVITAGKTVTRLAVRDQVASITYTGLTGTISFDANGDNAGAKVFAVYAVDPAKDPTKWSYETQINV